MDQATKLRDVMAATYFADLNISVC